MATQNQSQTAGAPPAAFFLVAIGGGVVGQDYARWMEVDPLVGAGIGGVIGMLLTGFLYHLYKDPEGKVRETCSALGAIAGFVIGLYIVGNAEMEGISVLISIAILVVIGAAVGQAVAAFISFAAFALLFISQGPIGLVVRTFIIGLNDG